MTFSPLRLAKRCAWNFSIVDVRLEYFEASGKAFVSLYWQSDLQPHEVIPQSQLSPAEFKQP